MKIERCTMPSFSVIGKEGSTDEGLGFMQRLWAESNGNFKEIYPLAAADRRGELAGIWGLRSDMGMNYLPWEENFTKGRYLAGVQVRDDAEAPAGWTKWTVPAYECVRVRISGANAFREGMDYLKENGLELVGGINQFMTPGDGSLSYLYFPIKRI